MSFRSGSVSYARFHLLGPAPGAVDEPFLRRLAAHVVRPPGLGKPPEIQAGFGGGRHVLDDALPHDACGFGSMLLAGVRIDVNRLPAELRRAYVEMAEGARAQSTTTGFLSRPERRAAREEAMRRGDEELAQGRHRRSRLVPLLWNLPDGRLLAPIGGDRVAGVVRDLFAAAVDLRLESRSAGRAAHAILEPLGLAEALEDARPSGFTGPPGERSADGERRLGAVPDVPWASAGPEPKDWLGNEFLLWLWSRVELDEGLVATRRGEIAVVIERLLDLDCAWGVTGRAALRGDAPTRLAEAAKALQHGKWPRRCGLILAGSDGRQWRLALQADRLAVSGAHLPEVDEAGSVREVIEQRLERTLELDDILLALYEAFLRLRMSAGWTAVREQLSEWIARRAATRVAA